MFLRLIFTIFLLLWFPLGALAAYIYPVNDSSDLGIGSVFEIKIMLDTEDRDVNAIEGVLDLPLDLIRVKKINTSNSVISFWLEEPSLSSGNIKFSGIIPGGYQGEGVLFSALVEANKEGSGGVSLGQARVLLNDGLGTETETSISGINFRVLGKADKSSQVDFDIEIDIYPPEGFTPIISSSPLVFDGQYFVVFNAQDKISGIDYYEVSENGGEFVRAESPHVLENQSMDTEVKVKAVDKNGNSRVEVVNERKNTNYAMYLTLVILILVVFLFGRRLKSNEK